MKRIVITFLITTVFWLNIIEVTHISMERYRWSNLPPSHVCDNSFYTYKEAYGPRWAIIIKELYKLTVLPTKLIAKKKQIFWKNYGFLDF